MDRTKSVIEDGWITGFAGVKHLGLMVRIQKYGIEGAIFAIHGAPSTKTSSFVSLGSTEAQSVASKHVYRIFDRVQVHIEVSSTAHGDEALVLTLFES